jgi:hypothetical protein
VADLAVGLAAGDELQYFGGKTIRLDPLTWSTTEHDAPLASRRDTGADPLAQQMRTDVLSQERNPELLLPNGIRLRWSGWIAKDQT